MRLTVCFSMYSDMSSRVIAVSSSNRKPASALASSVLPTPVGPRNRNEPVGRFGSFRPARARRTALDTARTASACPTTRSPSLSSMPLRRVRSPSSILSTGMPVQRVTTLAMSRDVTSSRSVEARASASARRLSRSGMTP